AGDRLDSCHPAGSANPAATPHPACGRRCTSRLISPSGDAAGCQASWKSPPSSVRVSVEAGSVTSSTDGTVTLPPDSAETRSASATAGKLPVTVSEPGRLAVTVALTPASAKVPVSATVVP